MCKTLLVVYHSMTQGSAQLAQAVVVGAQREPQCHTLLHTAATTTAEHILHADGLVLVTPENLGSMAGMMKDLFDRIYYPLLDTTQGKPYALLVCAGNDGTGCIKQIERIATGLRWRAVRPAIIFCTEAQTPAQILAPKSIAPAMLEQCKTLGEAFANGLTSGIY